jgi:hypothetical protein
LHTQPTIALPFLRPSTVILFLTSIGCAPHANPSLFIVLCGVHRSGNLPWSSLRLTANVFVKQVTNRSDCWTLTLNVWQSFCAKVRWTLVCADLIRR